MTADFNIDLAYSLHEGESDVFDKFYFRIFPHLEKVELVSDIAMQKQGVDKKLIFKNGKVVLIDEKKRRADYDDILLEEYSDRDRKKKGWLSGEKITDYIVYAFMPTKRIFIFPFLLLQRVWLTEYDNLLNKYGRKCCQNNGYVTTFIPVPITVLFSLLEREMEGRFSER